MKIIHPKVSRRTGWRIVMRRFSPFLFLLFTAHLLPAGEERDVKRVLRFHDLRFLVSEIPDFPAPPLALEDLQAISEGAGEQEPSFGGGYFLTPGTGISPDALVRLIRTNIAEDSWANLNNTIQVRGKELVVMQTEDVQRQIEELLEMLRARRARMVLVEIILVPADALGDPLREQPYRLPPGSREEILARAGKGARRIFLTAYNDQTVSATSGGRRAALTHIQYGSTGVVPNLRFGIRRLPAGITAEVRPRVVEGTGRIQLKLRISRVRLEDPVVKTGAFFAELEHVPRTEENLQTMLLLEPDRLHLAGIFEERWKEKRSFAVLVRARPADVQENAEGGAGRDEPFQLRAHDVSFLLDSFSEDSPGLGPKVLLRWIRAGVDPEAWQDGRAGLEIEGSLLLVTARAPTLRKVESWLRERLEQRGRMARITVRELEGPLEAVLEIQEQAGPDLALPRGWMDGEAARRLQILFRGTSYSLPGSKVEAWGARIREYLGEVRTISGGTGQVMV